MPAVTYPSTLPTPSDFKMKPAERRAKSDIQYGEPNFRPRQRDFGAEAQCEWVYSPAQMADWKSWFETTVVHGLSWFQAPMPGRGGILNRVVRYKDRPQRELLRGGNWRIRCAVYIRGASQQPDSASVPTVVYVDIAGSFTVVGSAQRDYVGRYGVRVTQVEADFTGAYSLVSAVVPDFLGAYGIGGAVQADFASANAVLGGAQRDLTGSYVVIGSVSFNAAGTYTVVNAVQQSFSGTYQVQN